MSTAEIKLKLFREIDNLDQSRLEQVCGLLLNFLNKENDTEEWSTLTQTQQNGLLNAIEELDSDEGIDHKSIIRKYSVKHA